MKRNLNKLIEEGEKTLKKANSNYHLYSFDIYELLKKYDTCHAVINAYIIGFALGSRFQLNRLTKGPKEANK